jgi:serine/threonine-protein kinase
MTKLLAPSEVERLDRFELIAELASGGMATVFLARLGGVAGFQRLVAIKRLHPHLAKDKEFIEMFLDEARLAARIHHPNVVPIVEVGATERGYYLVMEYIEGDTLARLFARSAQTKKRLPADVGIRVLLDALAGLHAAHELCDDSGQPLEIVHRDVSPQNILVGIDGSSRITDFGVARASSRLSTTRSGQLKGKLAYMAPEQARGARVDRRADLFAMGIILWETLAFKRLFKGDQEAETLNKVLYEPIPDVRDVAPSTPDELAKVTMKALDRDPQKRYRTGAELADDLEKAARAVRMLATARDVKHCIESVIGTEIEAQREAVRAWLARSEPSKNQGVPEVPPGQAQSITRIEAGRATRQGSASSPSHPRATSEPPGGRSPTTSSAPPGAHISSVSSAVIQVPPPPPAYVGPVAAPQPPPAARPLSRVVWAVALLALGGLVTFAVMRLRGGSSPGAASAGPGATTTSVTVPVVTVPTTIAPATPATSATNMVPASPLPAAAPTATLVASGNATADAPQPGAKGKPKPKGARGNATSAGTGAAPSTAAAPTATATPDDISHNPYR